MNETPLFVSENIIQLNNASSKNVVYRYQSDPENFINGELWFASANQNRIFNSDPDEHFYVEDKIISSVKCHRESSSLLCYVLSTSYSSPKNASSQFKEYIKNKKCIEIFDFQGFLGALTSDLRNQKNIHKLSWFNKAKLIAELEKARESSANEKCKEVDRIAAKKKTKHILNVLRNFEIRDFEIRDFENYYDDMLFKTDIGSIAARIPYHPSIYEGDKRVEHIAKALNISKEMYGHENELRIELNTTTLLRENQGDAISFENLVEYIKLSCPSIKNYCKLMPKCKWYR